MSPPPWPRVRAPQPEPPPAGARGRHLLCRAPRSRRESRRLHIPCIPPEHKLHGETRDGGAALPAPATPAPPPATPGSPGRDPAADFSASTKFSPPHPESVLQPHSRCSNRASARQTCSPPALQLHPDTRRLPCHTLHSRKAEHRHRPCAAPRDRKSSPSAARIRNPDRRIS